MSKINSSILDVSIPNTAAIAPAFLGLSVGTASSIKIPLFLTATIASFSVIPCAATIAAYSPRLKPAATSGFIPRFSTSFVIARQVVTKAACVYFVLFISSFSSKQIFFMSKSKTLSASSKILLALGFVS